MILKANWKDITGLVGSVTLGSNVDTLGDQLNFSMAYSPPYLTADVNVGDLIQLFDGNEVFRGIVITKTRNENTQEFDCFDYAFYLNKTKVIKQFNKIRADDAIRQLLAEYGVLVGYIAPMAVPITKIFYDKEVSAVIKEILQEVTDATCVNFAMEMNLDKFEVHDDSERLVKATVRPAKNLPAVDCMQTISDPTKTASIEDMKNRVKVFAGNEKGVKIYAEAENAGLISLYGLLQETKSVDEKNIAQAGNIATNTLKEFGKVAITASVTVLGSFDLRAGRTVEISEPVTNIFGKHKIKSASHSIGQTHTTSLELEMI